MFTIELGNFIYILRCITFVCRLKNFMIIIEFECSENNQILLVCLNSKLIESKAKPNLMKLHF